MTSPALQKIRTAQQFLENSYILALKGEWRENKTINECECVLLDKLSHDNLA